MGRAHNIQERANFPKTACTILLNSRRNFWKARTISRKVRKILGTRGQLSETRTRFSVTPAKFPGTCAQFFGKRIISTKARSIFCDERTIFSEAHTISRKARTIYRCARLFRGMRGIFRGMRLQFSEKGAVFWTTARFTGTIEQLQERAHNYLVCAHNLLDRS
jgi:hypothetical protein